jgi:hypothetical protein
VNTPLKSSDEAPALAPTLAQSIIDSEVCEFIKRAPRGTED